MNRSHLSANQALDMAAKMGRPRRPPTDAYSVLLAAARKRFAVEVGSVIDEESQRQPGAWPSNIDVPVSEQCRLIEHRIE